MSAIAVAESAPQPLISVEQLIAGGLAELADGRPEAAAPLLAGALEIDAEHGPAWAAFGELLAATGRQSQAASALRRAHALGGESAASWHRLGAVLRELADLAGAEAAWQRAAELAPAWPMPWLNLGRLALGRGLPETAIAPLRRALELGPGREPETALAHLDLGTALLLIGELAEGFREFEWRFWTGGVTPQFPGTTAPVWDGSALAGRTVMVWIEQGLGDSLQFVRYLRHLNELGGRVWLQVPRPLLSLYANLEGVERLVPEGEEVAGYDLQVPLLSLPRLCGTTLETIPAQVPYLQAPSCGKAGREALAKGGESFRVGLVWGSRPDHPAAPVRDCPLKLLAPLAEIPGLALYSLQFGPQAAELAACPAIVELTGVLGDFASTAALVQEMDLVITVDTAMAHLAGALGRRTWTLLAHQADWRWLQHRDDCPWYPTMRLVRQEQPGDWAGVIARVEQDLRREIAAR